MLEQQENNIPPIQSPSQIPSYTDSVENKSGGNRKKIILPLVIIIVIIVAVFLVYRFIKNSIKQDQSNENFYPVVLEDPVPGDRDRDGIPDIEEEKLGTSKFEFDTDGDGLTDLEEIEKWKTDPLNSDTDDDGFFDGYEVLKGFNPAGEGKLKIEN